MTRFFLLSIAGEAFLTSEAAGRLDARMQEIARNIGLLHRPEAVRLDIYQTDQTIRLADIEASLTLASEHCLQLTIHPDEYHDRASNQGDADVNDRQEANRK